MSHALGGLTGKWRMQLYMQQQAEGGRHGRHLKITTAYQQNSKFRQSMHIYVRNIPAKFHPDPIWNNGALGYFRRGHPNKQQNKNNKTGSDMGSTKSERYKNLTQAYFI